MAAVPACAPDAGVDVAVEAGFDAVLAREHLYHLDPRAASDLRRTLVWDAVRRHRETNPRFDRYCGVRSLPDDVDPDRPLSFVPLLPTALFKRGATAVESVAGSSVLGTTSSGTQGTVSVVPRCDTTLMRFFGSVAVGDREVLGSETFDRPVFHIGPTVADAPNLWIAYVMAGIGVIMPSRSYLRGQQVQLDELVHDIGRADLDAGVLLVGPPALVLDLAASVRDRPGLRLGDRSRVVTIGGWKRRSDEAVAPPLFREQVTTAFGLRSEEQVRDTFNMVELNSVLFECEAHALHVPPWVEAAARDPRSGDVLPSGTPGVLSFLDPSAQSYPCFLLTDDLGVVHRGPRCACGRQGDTVRVIRRVNRVETRGCALKLDTDRTPVGADTAPAGTSGAPEEPIGREDRHV